MKQKHKNSKKKVFICSLLLSLLALILLFRIVSVGFIKAEEIQNTSTEISKSNIDKKIDKETKPKFDLPQKDSTIYFAEPVVAEILTGDESLGFDDNDKPGYDSSEINDIVRSFDKIFYTFKINLDSQSKELYTDIVLKITGKVKNGYTLDGKMLNAKFSEKQGGAVDEIGKTASINYVIGGNHGGEGSNTGSNRTITLPLEVFGAQYGTELDIEEFSVQILSAKDSNGLIHDLKDENIVEKIQGLKSILVSSKVNLSAFLGKTWNFQYAPFNTITQSSDDAQANIRQFGVAVGVVPLVDRGTSLLGSAAPTGKVTVKLKQRIIKDDLLAGSRTELQLGVDTRPLQIFDYGLVEWDGPYENELNNPYPNYIRMTNNLFVPYSDYSNADDSVFKTGNINMVNNTDNTFEVSFDNYEIDMQKTPKRDKTQNIGTVKYGEHEKLFVSAGLLFKEPTEQLNENINLQYFIQATEIRYEDEPGNVIHKPNRNDGRWNEEWTLVKYPRGTLQTMSKYLDDNLKVLGTSDNQIIPYGDSIGGQGQYIKVRSTLYNSENFNAEDSDLMQKWNPNESTYVSVSRNNITDITGKLNLNLKEVKYGVSKNGDYSLKALNDNREEDYYWFISADEAQKNGEISAVSTGINGGKRGGQSYESFWVRRKVKDNIIGTKDKNGNPFITTTWGKLYYEEGKEKNEDYPRPSVFSPSVYEESKIIVKQTPNEAYGDTLNIVPYSVSIGKNAYKYNTEIPTSTFQSSDLVSWKLRPSIVTYANGELPEVQITIKDKLPKGMRYIADSGKIGTEYSEPQIDISTSDDKTTLTWFLPVTPGKSVPVISYETSFVQSEVEFNSSGIGALSNLAIISSDGDNSVEALRTAKVPITIIKEQKWEIDKTVSKPNPDYQPGNGKPEWVPGELVESDTSDALKYTLKVTNQTGKNIVNASILDVLPKDGEIGSLFEGKVDLKTIKILGNNKQVNPAGEAYYTGNPVPRDSNPNDIAEDLFSWEDYTGELNTGSPSTKVDANAVFALIPLLKDDESAYVEITVVFKGNQPGNIYKNIANGNAENYTGVVGSRNQVTRVINRLINGRVWLDGDHNGGIDPTEALKADVPVILYSVNAAGVKTKVKTNIRGDVFIDDSGTVLKKTDSDGKYEFDALPAGDYVVGFDLGNQITTNELYITKYEALGIIDRNNNNVPESPMEVDGTNYLTAMAKKINLPKAVNTISDGEKKDINLGVLGKPKLAAIKKVLDSSGNDIHDKKVKVGDTIRYEIEMTNTQANSVVENVKLSDTIPEGLKFVLGTLTVSVDGAPGTPIDNDRFDETGRILTTIATDTVQDLGDIVGPTGKIIVGFDVTIEKNASGKLVNVAKVSGDVVDKPKPDEKTTNEVENNTPPLPTLAKAVNVEEAKLGDVLTYTLTVGNAKGGGEWQNVVVTDNLPVYLSYVANTTKIDDVAKPDAGVWSNGKMSLPLGKIQSEEAKKITFDAKVISVPTDYQVINKVNATGQDKDDKPYAPKEAEVETPMYYRLLHVRQVILNNDETELVIPSTGYYDVSNQATATSSTNSSNHALTSGSTTKDSGPEIVADLYTSRYIGLDKTVKGVLISDRIPEYYEYVGHIATTDKSKLAKEHLSTLLPADSQTKLAFVDYAMADEYWVTIYLQPKFGQDKNDEPEESPRPYSWSGRINNFGQLK